MAGDPRFDKTLQGFVRLRDSFRRATLQRIARQWRRSLQFKTIVSTLLLVALAGAGIGAFLSHQIAGSLYEERLAQFRTEATTGLTSVKDNFRDTAASDRESTDRLVMDTLPLLQGRGADAERTYLLTPLPTKDPLYVTSSVNSGNITASGIPVTLSDAVVASKADESETDYVFWSPLELANGEPGIAFGTKVTLPPDNSEYALYLIYDLQSMQETLDDIHRILWIAGFLLLAISGTIAWIVTKAGLGAVSDAAAVSEKLAAGELQERMEVKGEDEVARLAASFNRMAGTLQDQITQLATLSQMQQVFVSDVSHELRTPLTTVRMAAEVLYDARESFDPMYRRSTELLYHQVERFQALLADLLEISRFDAGAAALDLEPTDVFHIIRDVIDATEPLANNLGSEVVVVSSESSCVVDADPRRIERILRNLLVNALEHGEGEPIEIAVAASADAVGIAVRDHGIGMTEDDAGRVFDRFWRADPARARTTGGSGLGLAIATEDTRLHSGWLEAWGEPGNGSCFRLTLPRRHGVDFESSPVPLSPDDVMAGPRALTAAAAAGEEDPDVY
ncbi:MULTISPECIES: MtrAB system histidine kinase MtrB [unclassified Arthrobacter]|uniref:MtrAB system histidine kinase MtrB n=1 Tax=unclassified Arthrobacter TaxID=235627 RepID=UPI001E38B340|nr:MULTISPECIES: MtrAB system histidine kinase MtrB [unclassified Arthrobacter]MCC9146440.1 HAMP domain-containing histidine kinase [Arthrobacter sp. zg-Y919]MDK1277670.1 MtrAB system histidine kinase MtrB [Arthrobacter sp. zg.Y919]MDM7989830.1 MtrAB system histidine kinase MtrB [Arthrobacter sp. zg-Y877]WIB02370.1 MtrAB system histidine kinase MtrB [Arthrobacter sp. zg-Y919]